MGRITDKVNKFLIRIANRLGIKRDNLLESAKEDLKTMGPVVNNVVAQEQEKNIEMSDHEKFVQQVKEDATKFDPSMMSKEDAIMKILEQQGLNPEFAKNPVSMDQISKIGKDILQKEGIERITKENLEEVKSKLKYSDIEISENGDFNYKDIYQDNMLKTRNKDVTTFSINENGMLEEKIWKKHDDVSMDTTYMTRIKNTYNKHGLQMEQEYDHSTYSEIHSSIPKMNDGQSWKLQRNSELVTGTYIYQENPNWLLNVNGDRVHGYIDNSNKGRNIQYNMPVVGEKKDLLNCYPPSNFKKAEEDMIEANSGDGKFYSKPNEEKYTNDEILQIFAKESEAIRKTAEENGLIEKEEELEQE